MTTHEIKIHITHYNRVKAGTKTFEIRKNDRYYQRGDQVIMTAVYEDGTIASKRPEHFPSIKAEIGDVYPIHDDFVVFSLLSVK